MNQNKLPDNWEALPVKDVTTGGTRRKVKYDQESNTVYLLDEHGNWTGEAAKAPTRPAETSAGSGADGEQQIRRPPKAKSKSTPIFIAIIVVLCVLLFIQNFSGPIASSQSYNIIIAMENIQPGETIKGKLASRTVSTEEYYKYAATGGLYLDTEYKKIEGYVATSFIPKDGYISYTNVGESFQATNPWTLSGAANTITIPIDATIDNLERFMWGNEITLTVVARSVIDTVKYPDAYRPSSPEVNGSSSMQSVQIDTYTLTDFTIVDVLNDQKRSLYSTYASLAAIPQLYQKDCLAARYETGNQVQSDIPAYIRIAVSEETAEWWEKITVKRYSLSVTIEITGVKCETAYQNETYLALKAMLPGMKSAWKASLEEDT